MRIRNQSAAEWLAASVVAAFCAGAVTLTDARPPANHSKAGLGMMQLLADEHARVAHALAEQAGRQRTQDLAADFALAQEKDRAVALADEGAPLRVATMRAAAPARLSTSGRSSAQAPRGALQLAHGPTMAPHSERPVGPPLTLRAAPATPELAKLQQPQGGLLRRVRAVVDTVERVPGWVSDAAGWIVDLPVQAIPRRLRAARLNAML